MLGSSSVALACAEREVLHLGDIIETMLRQGMTALMTDDRRLVAEVSRMDNAVDKLDEAVKLYVTRLTRESLDERDGHRAMEIISFSINLEHIGDIIDKNLMELVQKKIKMCEARFALSSTAKPGAISLTAASRQGVHSRCSAGTRYPLCRLISSVCG